VLTYVTHDLDAPHVHGVRGPQHPRLGTKTELGTPWRLVEAEPKGYTCGT